MEMWQQEKLEEFGKHWGRVQMLIQLLWDRCGIYMVDVHSRNITFEDFQGFSGTAPDSGSPASK